MARMIYRVDAWIVDKNGNYQQITGYPKPMDSKGYGNDPKKAFRRAMSEVCDIAGPMYKVDERQVQTVILMDVYGNVLHQVNIGELPEEVTE